MYADVEVKHELHSQENYDVRDSADRSLRSASPKALRTSRKRKSLHSKVEVDSGLEKKDAKKLADRLSTRRNPKISPSTQKVETIATPQNGQGLELERNNGMDDQKPSIMSIGSIIEKPQTNITPEAVSGNSSYSSRALKKSRKASRPRKSAVLKSDDDGKFYDSQGRVLGSQETGVAQHAAEVAKQWNSLHNSKVEILNSQPEFKLSQALTSVYSNNSAETESIALPGAQGFTKEQSPTADSLGLIEPAVADNDYMLAPLQPTPASKNRSGLRESPTIIDNEQKHVNYPESGRVLRKKQKRNIDVPDVHMSTSLTSRVITKSPSAPSSPCGSLSAMTQSSSPPLRVIIPIPSDLPRDVKPKKSKKRKRARCDSSAITDNCSEHAHFLQNNSRAGQSLPELPPLSMQNRPVNLMNVDNESESEIVLIRNENLSRVNAQEVQETHQPPSSNNSFRKRPNGLLSVKSRKLALKPKSIKGNQSQQTTLTPVHRAEERPTSNKRKPGATKPTVTGKFGGDEIAIIENEMLKYREMHDMTAFDQNQLVQDNANDASELFDEICKALPGRTRSSIIKICRRKFHNFDARGKWTEEDDKSLRAAYEKHPNEWKEISKTLNRHPEDVRDRWRNYIICGENLKKAAWTEDEEQKLRAAVEECLEDIRRARDEKAAIMSRSQLSTQPGIDLVDWQTISSRLGRTRSRLQCISKWKQLQEREATYDLKLTRIELGENSWRAGSAKRIYCSMGRADKYELLLAIQDSRAGTESKVPWAKIGNIEFRRKWPCMVRKIAWRRLRAKIPENENMKFQDIVYKLINTFREVLVDDLSDIDVVKPSQRLQGRTGKPALSEKYVHTDTEEESNKERRGTKVKGHKKDKRGRREIAKANTKKHLVKKEGGSLRTHKRKKTKKLRERMAKEGESTEQSWAEVNDAEADREEADDGEKEMKLEIKGVDIDGEIYRRRDVIDNERAENNGDDDPRRQRASVRNLDDVEGGSWEQDENYNNGIMTNNDQYQGRQSTDFEATSHSEGRSLQFDSPLSNSQEVGVSDDHDGEDSDILARRPTWARRSASVEL